MRMRELYYFDHGQDVGLSGFAGTLCSRATLRTDVPVVLALAGAQTDDEDDQLGRDVRLLLESPLPDEVLHAVWLAAVRRCFDPAEEGTDIRCWLRRVAEVCPPCTRERERAEPEFLDRVRPTVTEEDVRLLLDSALSDEAVTALWRTASRRLYVDASFDADEGFDADVRAWLERVARACRERLGRSTPAACRICRPPGPTWPGPCCARSARSARRSGRKRPRYGTWRAYWRTWPPPWTRTWASASSSRSSSRTTSPSPTPGATAAGPSANGSDSARTTWTTNCPAGRTDLPSGRAAEPSPEYGYSCVPGSRLTGSAV